MFISTEKSVPHGQLALIGYLLGVSIEIDAP